MNATNALKAYANVEIDSEVAAADPLQLILLLYQGALTAISAAKLHMSHNEIAAKGASISRAIAIIETGLKASLNMEVGGEMAQNLFDLYTYMADRLIKANLENDPAILDEISRLLIELRGAWEGIQHQAHTAQQAAPFGGHKGNLAYGRI